MATSRLASLATAYIPHDQLADFYAVEGSRLKIHTGLIRVAGSILWPRKLAERRLAAELAGDEACYSSAQVASRLRNSRYTCLAMADASPTGTALPICRAISIFDPHQRKDSEKS